MTAPAVLDWSGWRPDPRVLYAAGVRGASRYLYAGAGTEWKALTVGEDQALRAAGIAVACNWEKARDSWLGGYPAGLEHGAAARTEMRKLGRPDSRPIVFSIDTGVATSQQPVAMEYLRGCRDGGGCGPQRAYHGNLIIDMAVKLGYVTGGWMAMSSSWSPNPTSPNIYMKQLGSKSYPQFSPLDYDENTPVKLDWGQYPEPGGSTPMPAPYSLWQDNAGQVWRVAADSTIKVPTAGDALAVDVFFLTVGYGADAAKTAIGTQPNIVAWLNSIPNAKGIEANANAAAIAAVAARDAAMSAGVNAAAAANAANAAAASAATATAALKAGITVKMAAGS